MSERITEFFDRYRSALLARDEKAVAHLYSVPGLIAFPGALLPVADEAQTEAFFASAWPQYEGVEDVEYRTSIMGEAPATAWVDVTWLRDGSPSERFCYQLVEADGGYRIAVLTPMTVEG